MANNKLLVNERQKQLGNFLVGRLLPFAKKRQVGPFTFIDHMGPSTITPPHYIDVDQHPHIGLCTLTYLYEGAMEHRDSTGAIQEIGVGDVGFMTSGKGVTHTERTPASLRDGSSFQMHGYQIWVALPKENEIMDPQFDFYPSDTIPKQETSQMTLKVVAGEAFGLSSPLQGYSPMFMVDVEAHEDTKIDIRSGITGEVAFVIVKGSITNDGEIIEAGQMLISTSENECMISLQKGTKLLIFGGEPLPEERFLLWNFVSSDKSILSQAKEDWQQKRFPQVPHDDSYIPFPQLKK